MGSCASQELKEQNQINKVIEKQIIDDKNEAAVAIKLLLLGAGESGKSTILKQMKILHDNGFSEAEVVQRKAVVYSNTVASMATMLQAMYTLDIRLENATHEADAIVVLDVMKMGYDAEPFTDELYLALKALWTDSGVRECFARRNEFQMHDSAEYFLDAIDRTAMRDYLPTQQDILQTRVATTGVSEVEFVMNEAKFRVFDVGGQRSQRKKWIHCFDDVQAVIFISSLSEYDQVLREDNSTNRMVESMTLFGQICNSEWFVSTSMIVFLNKTDLFAAKIKRAPITSAFPLYIGAQTFDACAAFIEAQFQALNQNRERKVYMHQTCAVNTDQVQLVLDSVLDTVIRANLNDSGML